MSTLWGLIVTERIAKNVGKVTHVCPAHVPHCAVTLTGCPRSLGVTLPQAPSAWKADSQLRDSLYVCSVNAHVHWRIGQGTYTLSSHLLISLTKMTPAGRWRTKLCVSWKSILVKNISKLTDPNSLVPVLPLNTGDYKNYLYRVTSDGKGKSSHSKCEWFVDVLTYEVTQLIASDTL